MTFTDRIRAGEVPPWAPAGPGGVCDAAACRRSAQVARDELYTLPADSPRREGLEAIAQAWGDRAAILEEATA